MIHPIEIDKLLAEVVEAEKIFEILGVNALPILYQVPCSSGSPLTIYSDGAMNSMVLDLTSGRRVTSP